MIKSVIALLTAAVSLISENFSNIFDAVFYPEAPQTESVEFAENLGNSWTDRVNLENLAEKADFFVSVANKFGIPCLVWDNGLDFRVFDRATNTVEFPDYVVI